MKHFNLPILLICCFGGLAFSQPETTYSLTGHIYNAEPSVQKLLFHPTSVSSYLFTEIGPNDFRLSMTGPDGDPLYDAHKPAMAYNPVDHEFLIVWAAGDNNPVPLYFKDGQTEIYGQRFDAATGLPTGASQFRISDMGPEGDIDYDAYDPAVVYNPVDHEYLVVWSGDDVYGSYFNSDFEIHGQRLDASTGAEIGVNDFQISFMGDPGYDEWTAHKPDVVYNPLRHEYLVAWSGCHDEPDMNNFEMEIYVQRLNASGASLIGGHSRISTMGPSNNSLYDAENPAIAYNEKNNLYLVVWESEDTLGGRNYLEVEIFGQLLDGTSGTQIGPDDFLISDMGPDPDGGFDAFSPDVAYNTFLNEFLVIWSGETLDENLINNEFEIFGQRIHGATGAEVGTNDFRITYMGPDNPISYLWVAQTPTLTYNPLINEFLIAWSGSDQTASFGGLAVNEFEIYAKRLNGFTYQPLGERLRLSDMGPDGDPEYDGFDPCLGFNPLDMEYWVAWEGDDDTAPLVDDEFEIFLQRTSILNCQNDLILDGGIPSGLYVAEDSISITGQLDSGAYLSARAPVVSLQAGAQLKKGSFALIRTGECPGNLPLVEPPSSLRKPLPEDETAARERAQIILYPNPAKEHLYIDLGGQKQTEHLQWRLVNLKAELILVGDFSGHPPYTINLKTLPNGIYFLQVYSQKNRWIGRFIKH
jgi:hypothetical protein